MSDPILRRIELDRFDNELGLSMGLAVIHLAKERGQHIAVQVERLNHIVFLYIDEELPADKHHWMRRKSNIVKHFEESSLGVKQDLEAGRMTLDQTFALDPEQYVAKGGSIPIFVKNAGMVASQS